MSAVSFAKNFHVHQKTVSSWFVFVHSHFAEMLCFGWLTAHILDSPGVRLWGSSGKEPLYDKTHAALSLEGSSGAFFASGIDNVLLAFLTAID
jgi:hypothetical protein